LKVLVDCRESLVEFLLGNGVDFLDRRLGVFDRFQQVFALRVEKSWRCAVSLYSSKAIMLTGPMESSLVRIRGMQSPPRSALRRWRGEAFVGQQLFAASR